MNLKMLCCLLLVLGVGMQVSAQTPAADKRKAQFNAPKGVMLEGYDPVAYFTEGKAVKGSASRAAKAEGVIYYFATDAHKEAFLKDYKKYEPQYGGWCAYAMGNSGEKVEIDPETFKIVNGKLYVFYNAYFNNTLKSWNKNEAELMKKADQNWKKFYP